MLEHGKPETRTPPGPSCARKRRGELVDEVGFGFGLGTEVVEVLAEVGLVVGFGFVFEEDGAGGEAVGEGVAGGDLFAGGGFGASGFGAVGAGGLFF